MIFYSSFYRGIIVRSPVYVVGEEAYHNKNKWALVLDAMEYHATANSESKSGSRPNFGVQGGACHKRGLCAAMGLDDLGAIEG